MVDVGWSGCWSKTWCLKPTGTQEANLPQKNLQSFFPPVLDSVILMLNSRFEPWLVQRVHLSPSPLQSQNQKPHQKGRDQISPCTSGHFSRSSSGCVRCSAARGRAALGRHDLAGQRQGGLPSHCTPRDTERKETHPSSTGEAEIV